MWTLRFHPLKTSSKKHTTMAITLCSLVQISIPLSSVNVQVPSLMSSSTSSTRICLHLRGHNTHFCNFSTWFVLASFGGLAFTVRSIALPCKNAVLTSVELNIYFFDAIIGQARRRLSLEHVRLCVLEFCSSSKSLGRNIVLMAFSLSTNISLITHLGEMQSWPWSCASL